MIALDNKGLGFLERAVDPKEIAALDWNLLHEDLSLPVAVLYQDKLQHNLQWMQQFIAAYGVKLAPHGKTTMAPRLFKMQLETGAWGITLATAHQTLVAYQHGVRRVLLANQLVGRENMAIISRLLRDPEFDFYCLVDSPELVDHLGEYFSAQSQKVQVLIELGPQGGRTGVRDASQLESVLRALEGWRGTLALSGVEVYEGVLDNEVAIREFLGRAVATLKELEQQKRFDRNPPLLTGAGSAWYDVVAEVFSTAGSSDKVEIVLRPGCYLTHDTGAYKEAQEKILERNPIAGKMRDALKPALQVWSYVSSVPEKGRAIIAMGKRDVAFDAGLPAPVLHFRPGGASPKQAPAHWRLTKMMDQHAYLEIGEGDDIKVGDMIGFDISHPCLTFDKWKCLPVLDSNYRVMDVIQTYF